MKHLDKLIDEKEILLDILEERKDLKGLNKNKIELTIKLLAQFISELRILRLDLNN
tara:strand:+ start:247 stop:414 length:168 start_codon:yes stop_codon:yes gene_type:complete